MILYFRTDAEIADLTSRLVAATLPKPAWTHAAHFAAALWLLRYESGTLSETLPPIIQRYNEASGTRNTDITGYHDTITQASIRAAAAFMSRFAPDHSVCDIANRLMATNLGRSDWLLAYWSRERLFSTQARRAWTPPDIHPLPY